MILLFISLKNLKKLSFRKSPDLTTCQKENSISTGTTYSGTLYKICIATLEIQKSSLLNENQLNYDGASKSNTVSYPRTSTNKSILLLFVSSCLRLESSARGGRRILTIRDEEGGIHGRASGASNRFSSTTKNRDLRSVGPSPTYRQIGKESRNVNVSMRCRR